MLRFSFYFLLSAFVVGIITFGAVLWSVFPQLPSAQELREVHLQTPLRVYTADGRLIAEFGEKRRHPVFIEDVPRLMQDAFIASEDDRFYTHPGVDWMAIARAAIELMRTREKKQGGSTITMQVARNFFLTPEKTYTRKIKEIFLAVKIEQELSKDEILELYLNKIFLGHRAYGVGAAAQVYFGASLAELTLGQTAMIAGLPQAPSNTNPVRNPKAAEQRREYVLSRMLKLGFIDKLAYDDALQEPVATTVHGLRTEVSAPYLAEMVRSKLLKIYPDDVYTAGYRVFTTVKSDKQQAANNAVTKSLLEYDRRHGYRGAEHHFDITPGFDGLSPVDLLKGYSDLGSLRPAFVIAVSERGAKVVTTDGETLILPWEGIKWARGYLSQNRRTAPPQTAGEVLQVGDVVRIEWQEPILNPKKDVELSAVEKIGYWHLAQIPEVEGALVSLKSKNGAIEALVGGFEFKKSKFNRVTQAMRQPGSNFKPFIYSAALEAGFTAASFVNDAPIVFDAPGIESTWRPENYSGKSYGPTPLRKALAHSRNLISIRLLREIGVNAAVEHVARFGFDVSRLPKDLSMSLGSGELTLRELVSAYAVLSNGGYRIEPYFIERIETKDGEVIYQAEPLTVYDDGFKLEYYDDDEPVDIASIIKLAELGQEKRPAPRVLDAGNAWIMNSMMRDVIKIGTGRRALQLKREDLAGKTGTTNDQKDAWFSGFNGDRVTTVWVGFDDSKPLGKKETGSSAALPMWIDYMRTALIGAQESVMERPPGVVTVKIDPSTGL
ncbi:MAG: penicillin-binding protein 1A, partial [Gammaproteobacteria bacterium]